MGIRPILAAMSPPILLAEPFLFGGRTENLGPSSVLEHAHVSALQYLERFRSLVEMVESRRTRLSEPLEPGGINEIAHRNTFHGEFLLLDGVGSFVRVDQPSGPVEQRLMAGSTSISASSWLAVTLTFCPACTVVWTKTFESGRPSGVRS